MARSVPLERIGEIMKVVLTELQAAGGEERVGVLLNRAGTKLQLSDYEKATYEKSGYIRWRVIVHFYSIGCVKAGYIQKSGGRWKLTEEGAKALKLPAGEFIQTVNSKYRAWKSLQPLTDERVTDPETEKPESENTERPATVVRQIAYEQAVEQARSEIEDHINEISPYDFQKLVGALLVGMGYYVPRIASPGPDGGVDVVAYRDPLGVSSPRLKVQVKHREQKVTVQEVRELEGVLRKEGDIGLIVSSGGFTAEAEREIRSSPKHIETMDLDRLITLWERHYDSIPEPGRTLLPLVKLSFLAPDEE
jgi:restriction system protein